MICDLCKANDAVIHIEKHFGDTHKKLNLCQACAGLNNLTPDNMNPETIQELISNISNLQESYPETACSECGLDSAAFMQSQILGCSRCYEELKEVIDLQNWHKQVVLKHIGKIPPNFQLIPANQLKVTASLESKLQEAISNEEFEKAAQIRDQIKSTKKDNDEL